MLWAHNMDKSFENNWIYEREDQISDYQNFVNEASLIADVNNTNFVDILNEKNSNKILFLVNNYNSDDLEQTRKIENNLKKLLDKLDITNHTENLFYMKTKIHIVNINFRFETNFISYLNEKYYFGNVSYQQFLSLSSNNNKSIVKSIVNNYVCINQLRDLKYLYDGYQFENKAKLINSFLVNIDEKNITFDFFGDYFQNLSTFNLESCFRNSSDLNKLHNEIETNDGKSSYTGEIDIYGKNGRGYEINFYSNTYCSGLWENSNKKGIFYEQSIESNKWTIIKNYNTNKFVFMSDKYICFGEFCLDSKEMKSNLISEDKLYNGVLIQEDSKWLFKLEDLKEIVLIN